jgi:hypothetical protein
MIKILHNLALFRVKNANFFAEFFGKNIVTSVPCRKGLLPVRPGVPFVLATSSVSLSRKTSSAALSRLSRSWGRFDETVSAVIYGQNFFITYHPTYVYVFTLAGLCYEDSLTCKVVYPNIH